MSFTFSARGRPVLRSCPMSKITSWPVRRYSPGGNKTAFAAVELSIADHNRILQRELAIAYWRTKAAGLRLSARMTSSRSNRTGAVRLMIEDVKKGGSQKGAASFKRSRNYWCGLTFLINPVTTVFGSV